MNFQREIETGLPTKNPGISHRLDIWCYDTVPWQVFLVRPCDEGDTEYNLSVSSVLDRLFVENLRPKYLEFNTHSETGSQ